MRKTVVAALGVLLLSSCTAPRLYYWGASPSSGTTKYEKLAYKNYDQQTPQALCELVVLYEDMVSHPGGTRKVVPPGICAEYGFLLLQPATAEAFMKHATNKQRKVFNTDNIAEAFSSKGEEMLKKEMELYPESAKFIAPLLKRLTGK